MKQRNELIELIRETKPNKQLVLRACIYSALNKTCDIFPEILISIAIDVVINQEQSIIASWGIINPYQQLYTVGALTAIFWILEAIFEYLYAITWNKIAQHIQHELRLNAYQNLQQLDMSYFEHKTNGELLSLLQDDIYQLELFLSRAPNEFVQLIVNIIIMGTVFFLVSPTIALLALLPIPFIVGISLFFQRHLAILYEKVRTASAELTAHISYRLQGITTIKSYTTENYELEFLHKKSALYQDANYEVSKLNSLYIPTLRMAIMSGFIMALIVGGVQALQGLIAINWYATLVFLTQRFLWPFVTITIMADMYERSLSCAKRILPLIKTQPSIQSGQKILQKNTLEGAVSFEAVCFGYNKNRIVFNDMHFTIPAKKTAAFVGTTGSGKSTVIHLLLRFYEPHGGSIRIDDHNITELDIENLRNTIALVNQEIYLVEGTIADNIAYGNFNASREEIIHAAQMAQIHEFIMQLPEKYDTWVHENGKNFSGGQKQRISIARAILKNAPILIFDEATSALDNETQAAIQESINQLKESHTIIIIAHHLSTVRDADIIFVLENGVIIESGTHNELIKLNGHYAHLCTL